MTETYRNHPQRVVTTCRSKHRRPSLPLRVTPVRCVTILLSSILFWYALRDPLNAADAVKAGLSLCIGSVIPSLFPFLVLSSLILSSGIGASVGKLLSPVMKRLFGVSGNGSAAILLGAFCGFPIGAKCVSELYAVGAIERKEAERLLGFSNNPSFAFLFSTVGAGFFGDKGFGLRLYGAVLLSVLLSGILMRTAFGSCTELSHNKFADSKENTSRRLSAAVTNAVSSAAHSMLTISSFVVFFTVLSRALSVLSAALNLPSLLSLVLSGILELTGGIKNAAETVGGLCGRVLCGFFAGWGGLCAHLQVIATAERSLPDRAPKNDLSFRSYFFCKFLQAGLCAFLTGLFEWV